MKSIVHILCLLAISTFVHAQAEYDLEVRSEPYTSFATEENKMELTENFEAHELGFEFTLGSYTIDNITLSKELQRSAVLGTKGAFTGRSSFILPFFMQSLEDDYTGEGAPYSIHMVREGTDGKRIAKLECKNVYISQDGSKLDLQIWLHEDMNKLEYRYGPQEFKDASIFEKDSINVGYMGFVDVFQEKVSDAVFLTGSPAEPTLVLYDGTQDNNKRPVALKLAPRVNTVYAFTNKKTNSIKPAILDDIAVQINPNPARNYISVALNDDQTIEYVSISSLDGKIVRKLTSGYERIDVSELTEGTYMATIVSNKGTSTKKIVIVR